MKILTEAHVTSPDTNVPGAFVLPRGLIGFAGHSRAELLYLPDNRPLLWLKLSGPLGTVNFVAVEPGGMFPGYEVEISDNDAETLGLSDPADAMILNIVTVESQIPAKATVNLAGPIVVNRRTLVGEQIIIANYSNYSARHALAQVEDAACVTG